MLKKPLFHLSTIAMSLWLGGVFVASNGASSLFVSAWAVTIDEVKQNAENGDMDSQFSLGVLHLQGRGVQQDYAQALKWFKKAAAQNMPQAQSNLAVFYLNGWGGARRNPQKAFELSRKAALQGFADAQLNLSRFYREGIGVKKNLKEASKWLKKAALQGHAHAQMNLGVEKHRAQDYKEARKWFERSAEQDQPIAQYMYGQFLQKGIGGKKDVPLAISWFESAAQHDLPDALFSLADIYLRGLEGYPQDLERAYGYYLRAAELEHPVSQYNVGVMLKDGQGAKKNLDEALKWLSKSGRGGYGKAYFYLGDLYARGKGLKQDYALAYQYFWLARKLGWDVPKIRLEVLEKTLTPDNLAKAKKDAGEIYQTHHQKAKAKNPS